MILAGNEGADFPSDPSINLEHQRDDPTRLILSQGHSIVRGHGDGVTVNVRRPNVDLLVALISGREGGLVSDLLAMVSGVKVKPVVVNTDSVIRVSGGNGDLEAWREDVRVRDVEDVNGGVLEDEPRFRRAEDGPHDEDGD